MFSGKLLYLMTTYKKIIIPSCIITHWPFHWKNIQLLVQNGASRRRGQNFIERNLNSTANLELFGRFGSHFKLNKFLLYQKNLQHSAKSLFHLGLGFCFDLSWILSTSHFIIHHLIFRQDCWNLHIVANFWAVGVLSLPHLYIPNSSDQVFKAHQTSLDSESQRKNGQIRLHYHYFNFLSLYDCNWCH